MFSALIGKKKIREGGLAKALVSGSLQAGEKCFHEMVQYLEECPHFDRQPNLSLGLEGRFHLAILTCNLALIPKHLPGGQDKRVAQEILHEVSDACNIELQELGQLVKACKSKMKRLNHPSKILLKGVPKVIFDDFGLNPYQQAYFKDMNAPNPLILKDMTDMVEPLIWDWNMIKEHFKLAP